MSEQSKLSKFSLKQLVFISEKLLGDDFEFENPYDDYDGNFKKVTDTLRYFNFDVVDLDMEFISKFIYINENLLQEIIQNGPNSEKYEKLKIPQAKTYDLHYTVWGSCTYTDYFAQNFDSYDKKWVRDSAEQQRADGNWDLYDGRMVRKTEYDNCEESDNSYDEIYEVNDDKTINTNFVSDSKKDLFSKLVVENTKELINKIDRESLVLLRNLINKKLSS